MVAARAVSHVLRRLTLRQRQFLTAVGWLIGLQLMWVVIIRDWSHKLIWFSASGVIFLAIYVALVLPHQRDVE